MKHSFYNRTLFLLLVCISTSRVLADIGTDNPTGISGQFNGNVTTACSYDPYTGNATRSVTDLVVAGGVGSYPLAFTRTMNSRYIPGVGNIPAFGTAGTWTHSYQWSIDPVTVSKNGGGGFGPPASYNVNYPDGRRIVFTNIGQLPSGASDPYFRGPLGVRDRFQQLTTGATECYLRLADGGKVWFHATTTPLGGLTKYTFTLMGIIDPYGQTTTITYPSALSLTITEPAGRSINVFGRTITNTAEGASGDQVVDHVTGSDGRSVYYNYTAYVTANGTRYTSLSSVRYFGDPTLDATYTYQAGNTDPNTRPLIATCIDPMFDGPMWKIAYDFAPNGTNADGSAVAYGQLWREKHINGTPVSTLTINAKASNGYNSRTETRGDNPTGGGNPSRTFTYDGYRLKTTTDFKGAVGTQNYDNNYYLQSVVDRNGNTTGYQCKAYTGMIKEVDYPTTPGDTLLGTPQTILKYTYDDDNNPYFLSTITNGYTKINTYIRDANHQITKITYPDTNVETFTYNSFGEKLTHTFRGGSVETWQYDSAGRVIAYWDAAHPTTGNATTRYIYDGYGRIWKTTEGRGTSAGDSTYTTTFEYNSRGQLTKLTHPDGTYVQNVYNPNGTVASTIDELNHRHHLHVRRL